MKNYIYITALTNDRYLPGALALVRSMKQVKAQYPLAIMIPESISDALSIKIDKFGILDYENVFLLIKPDIILPDSISSQNHYWTSSFFKLQAVSCFEYDKIILLDCDQMAVKNFDHLFEKPNMTATSCGRCIHPDWMSLSAGMLVIEPSRDLYHQLLSNIEPAIRWKYHENKNVGDQDVFNYTFPNWKENNELYIPEYYNICHGMINALCDKENIEPDKFYMIHFPGKVKPWHKNKRHYIKIMLSLLMHGDIKRINYRVSIWKKYRYLCEK